MKRFAVWTSKVNEILATGHGVEILDMPDIDMFPRYDAGMSPGLAVIDMIGEWRNDGLWYDDSEMDVTL